MSVVNVLLVMQPSQSNGIGNTVGETGTITGVPYWWTSIGGTDASAWTTLTTGHGADVTIGRILRDAGAKCAILNIGRGATSAGMWIPGGTYNAALYAEIAEAMALLPAQFPAGTKYRFIHVADQGEYEARDPDINLTLAWASRFEACHAQLEAYFGVRMERVVVYTNYNIQDRTYPDELRAQQVTAALGGSRGVNRDAVEYEEGGVHMTTAGYIQKGALVAAKILELIHMGSLLTFSRDALANHVCNKAAYSPPANHYAAYILADGNEVSGNGYARAANTNNTTTWPNAAARTKTNGVPFSFPSAAGGDWGSSGNQITKVRIYDAASGGNALAEHTLVSPFFVLNTKNYSIPAGAITITMPANAMPDAQCHSALNLLFGGTAWAQVATAYVSYWAGDPQGAGVQAGSRAAFTQATAWNSASGGVCTQAAAITLADQVTGTHVAIHDASSAGNLILSVAGVNTGGALPIGKMRVVFT